jgi:hypothetical protein
VVYAKPPELTINGDVWIPEQWRTSAFKLERYCAAFGEYLFRETLIKCSLSTARIDKVMPA